MIPFREREGHRMRPKKRDEKGTGDLFRARLDQIIDMKHELVRPADEIDWAWIDDGLRRVFRPRGDPEPRRAS